MIMIITIIIFTLYHFTTPQFIPPPPPPLPQISKSSFCGHTVTAGGRSEPGYPDFAIFWPSAGPAGVVAL